MSPVAEDTRRALIERAERVTAAVSDEAPPAERAGAEREAWLRCVQDSVLDLSQALPAGIGDYDARQLLELLTELGRAIADDAEATDPKGRVRLTRMRMLDVARRMRRGLEQRALDDPNQAARFVFERLPELRATEFSELLGVSTKTISAWRHGSPVKANTERVVAVANVVAYIQSSMTPRGLMLWMRSEQDALDGWTPIRVLEDGSTERVLALTGLARGGRGQLAS